MKNKLNSPISVGIQAGVKVHKKEKCNYCSDWTIWTNENVNEMNQLIHPNHSKRDF